jgi:hypothetical protein
MIRTQIQFTDKQWHALKRLSAERRQSMAELVRQSVDHEFTRQSNLTPLLAIAGKFSSGRNDVSAAHDQHLAEDFG